MSPAHFFCSIHYPRTMERFNQTFTNLTKRVGLPMPEWHLYLWFSVSMLIGAIGGILILLLLIVMHNQKKLTVGSGLLIAHAQFIDFIMCAIENPLQNTGLLFQALHISMGTNCPFTRFSLITMQAVGNWTNVFVAVNRFVAVVLPYYYHNIATRPLLLVNILLGWCVALAITIPHYVLKIGVVFGLSSTGTCVIVKMDPFMFLVISTFVFYLPIGIVGVLYGIIYAKWLYLKRRHRVDPGVTENGLSPVLEKRFKVAKVLMITFIWYCVCYFPATFLPGFFYHLYKDDKRIEYWGKTLLYLGYAVNPLFFFAMSTEYRNGAWKLLRMLRAARIKTEISNTYKAQRGSMPMNTMSDKVGTEH